MVVRVFLFFIFDKRVKKITLNAGWRSPIIRKPYETTYIRPRRRTKIMDRGCQIVFRKRTNRWLYSITGSIALNPGLLRSNNGPWGWEHTSSSSSRPTQRQSEDITVLSVVPSIGTWGATPRLPQNDVPRRLLHALSTTYHFNKSWLGVTSASTNHYSGNVPLYEHIDTWIRKAQTRGV